MLQPSARRLRPLSQTSHAGIIAVFLQIWRIVLPPITAEDMPMTNLETIDDADADIAVLVYASGDRPDPVLCAFRDRCSLDSNWLDQIGARTATARLDAGLTP